MDPTETFESHRRQLEGIAYRMLGTLADAQDVVQDTYLKWSAADHDDIANQQAWLVKACTRRAMDVLKSARVRRETYAGPWLPEPYLATSPGDPAARLELDESVSLALMLALEKLSPAERAVYLLHEVFDYPFDEIATMLDRQAAACRQLASRARRALAREKPRFESNAREHRELLEAFLNAAWSGDSSRLTSLLAASVELHSDGGGKVAAAQKVIHGADRVADFLFEVWKPQNQPREKFTFTPAWFNGAPAILLHQNGKLITALSLAIEAHAIHRIYALRNPEKLAAFDNH